MDVRSETKKSEFVNQWSNLVDSLGLRYIGESVAHTSLRSKQKPVTPVNHKL
jgi:hypothetical protein